MALEAAYRPIGYRLLEASGSVAVWLGALVTRTYMTYAYCLYTIHTYIAQIPDLRPPSYPPSFGVLFNNSYAPEFPV